MKKATPQGDATSGPSNVQKATSEATSKSSAPPEIATEVRRLSIADALLDLSYELDPVCDATITDDTVQTSMDSLDRDGEKQRIIVTWKSSSKGQVNPREDPELSNNKTRDSKCSGKVQKVFGSPPQKDPKSLTKIEGAVSRLTRVFLQSPGYMTCDTSRLISPERREIVQVTML